MVAVLGSDPIAAHHARSCTRKRRHGLLRGRDFTTDVVQALAAAGIFGVVLHATSRRVREIGIRIALGARRDAVVAMIARSGLRPVVLGIAVACTVPARRVTRSGPVTALRAE